MQRKKPIEVERTVRLLRARNAIYVVRGWAVDWRWPGSALPGWLSWAHVDCFGTDLAQEESSCFQFSP